MESEWVDPFTGYYAAFFYWSSLLARLLPATTRLGVNKFRFFVLEGKLGINLKLIEYGMNP